MNCPVLPTNTTFRESGSVLCYFPGYQTGVYELPFVQFSSLCGFLQLGLDLFAHHAFLSATGFQELGSEFSCGCLLLFPLATESRL